MPQEWLVSATFNSEEPANSVHEAEVLRQPLTAQHHLLQPPIAAENWFLEQIYFYDPNPEIHPEFRLISIIDQYPIPQQPATSSVNLTKLDMEHIPDISIRIHQSIRFEIVNVAPIGPVPVEITFRVKIGIFYLKPRKQRKMDPSSNQELCKLKHSGVVMQ
jgi:hypothetical protein